jgi:hypothetical protein
MIVPPTLYIVPAVLAAAQQRLLAPFREAGATSPERAIPLEVDKHARNPQFQSLLRRGVLVEASPGRYYLDEAAITRESRANRPVLAVIALALLAAGLAAVAGLMLG